MGHHGFGSGGHHAGLNYGVLAGMPRGLKILLLLFVFFMLLVGVALVIAVVLVLLKLLSGASLPTLLQNALDLVRQNLQPLLDLWKNVQALSKK